MAYVLVLQWNATSIADFDALVAMEDRLGRTLGPGATVDGHDFGSGEMNIFVFTDEPAETFDAAQRSLGQEANWNEVRAAYRDRSEEQFTVLWPPGLSSFSVA